MGANLKTVERIAMWHCSQQECSTVKTYALIALDFVAPQTVPAQNCFAQGSKCGIADRNTLQDCSTIKTYALIALGFVAPQTGYI